MRSPCLMMLMALAAPAFAEGRKVAFLVGVGEYAYLPEGAQLGLPPVNDVKDVSKILSDAGFEIVLLKDEKATRQQVMNQLENVLHGRKATAKKKLKAVPADNALTADDLLLFQFSGHGFQGTLDGKVQPLLVAHDSKTDDTKTMVPFNEVLALIGKTKVKAVCLIDACRNELGKKSGFESQQVQVPKGVSIFFSCREGQRSQQDARFGHGLFTQAILDVCRGRRKIKDNETLTWDALVSDVKDNFTKGDMKKRLGKIEQSPHTSQGEVGVINLLKVTKAFKFKIPAAGTERSLTIADGVEMKFCWIPAGRATLGSPKSEVGRDADDEEEHDYQTAGFWMGKYPVTQMQWASIMASLPFHYSPASLDVGVSQALQRIKADTSDFPAENVSWFQARNFVQKLQNESHGRATELFGSTGTFALPLADDWEYAARGGKGNRQPFYWGKELNGDKANMNGTEPYGTTTKGTFLKRPSKVGDYEKIAPHPWKLCDITGNVWQWCDSEDITDDTMRIMRGGSWSAHGNRCRIADRNPGSASGFMKNIGFRVCFFND
jgi:formylglycine-generating enzyme required for sulfatase activity